MEGYFIDVLCVMELFRWVGQTEWEGKGGGLLKEIGRNIREATYRDRSPYFAGTEGPSMTNLSQEWDVQLDAFDKEWPAEPVSFREHPITQAEGKEHTNTSP